METVVVNVLGKSTVRKTSGGREYLIAPLSMIVSGVMNGSRGALYYPADEIALSVPWWNGIPIVSNHPVNNGTPVSARDPEVFGKHGLGHVYNSSYNGKLAAEGWFDVERVRSVDARVLSALESGTPFELSTGLFTRNDPAPKDSVYNGVAYSFIARDYRPDHLAVLMDSVGACSLRDGCGVLVNGRAPKESRRKMLLELFRMLWPEKRTKKLEPPPAPVASEGGDMKMNEAQRKAAVEILAVNCSCWGKPEDRETLNRMSDDQLSSLVKAQFSAPATVTTVTNPAPVTAPVPVAQPVQNALPPEVVGQLTTMAQSMQVLNTTVQALVDQQKAAQDSVKKTLVANLVSRVAEAQRPALEAVYNTMTPEQLGVILANTPASDPTLPIYMQGGVIGNLAGGPADDQPLDIPVINYEEDSAFAVARKLKSGAA